MCESGVVGSLDYNSDSHLQERRRKPKKIIVKTKEQTSELYIPFNLGKTNRLFSTHFFCTAVKFK